MPPGKSPLSSSLPLPVLQEWVAIDIETTGLNPDHDRIIEIAVVRFNRMKVVSTYTQKVNPQRRVSKEILRLTGLRLDELEASPPFGVVESDIREAIGDTPIIAHNAPFDMAMLAKEGITLSNQRFDTYTLASALMPDMPNYSLDTLAEAFGYRISQDERHRAMGDTLATIHLFRSLLDRVDTFDSSTLTQVAMFARIAGWGEAALFEHAARERRAHHDDGVVSVPLDLLFLKPRERPEPLRPTGSQESIDADRIERLLGEGGPLSHVLERYESRPTQRTMARRVVQSLNDEQRLLVEAGTGTGKSLAYLLPAAMFAIERGERVVVSTATIALQDQLQRKDLPDVHTALVEAGVNHELNVAVMKGRQNYLCLKQWFLHMGDPIEDPADAALRAKILLWLGRTETGDRAELRLSKEEERHWRKFASERGRCTVGRCSFASSNQCFFHRARHNAAHAHIVIANHSLMLSNAAEGRVLPPFERLIIDEAHHLEDEATRQLSLSVDRPAIDDAVNRLVNDNGGALPIAAATISRIKEPEAIRHTERARTLESEALKSLATINALTGELFNRLNAIIGKPNFGGSGYAQSRRVTRAMRDRGKLTDAELIWEQLDNHLRGLIESATWFLQVLEDIPLPADNSHPMVVQRDDAIVELMTGIDELSEIVRALNECFVEMPESKVFWAQRSGQQHVVSFNSAPLDVSTLLSQLVYAQLRTVVLTSATLTIDGSFAFIAEHLGLEGAKVLDLGSPFDHEASTLIYVPEDMPEPNHPHFNAAMADVLQETLIATEGRALVLFTSHRALREARNALKAPLERHNILVLGQGIDGSPRSLVDRLRNEPGTVVFGTSSFWEGVDVVGDALSLVVITKFPFAVPSDPIFEARSEQYENSFLELALPLAVLKFKQGFGRLIRTDRDRGVCVILDRRAISKRYGTTFIQSLPPTNVEYGSTYDLPGRASSWIGTRALA